MPILAALAHESARLWAGFERFLFGLASLHHSVSGAPDRLAQIACFL